jgi:hypothetical protein
MLRLNVVRYPGIARVSNSLFGISLTSVDPQAAAAIFEFFWPHALKNGWREIYLGSPVSGLKCALDQDSSLDAKTYIYARRGGLPLDPQLRYYRKKGFTDIVSFIPLLALVGHVVHSIKTTGIPRICEVSNVRQPNLKYNASLRGVNM